MRVICRFRITSAVCKLNQYYRVAGIRNYKFAVTFGIEICPGAIEAMLFSPATISTFPSKIRLETVEKYRSIKLGWVSTLKRWLRVKHGRYGIIRPISEMIDTTPRVFDKWSVVAAFSISQPDSAMR